jgi:uncharacterized protein YdhG (YjbR/CyaY superfamily)
MLWNRTLVRRDPTALHGADIPYTLDRSRSLIRGLVLADLSSGRIGPLMKRQGNPGSHDVDEYLARVPAHMRAVLQRLRKTIRAVAPQAEEVLSYRIPAFRQNGMLVYYAAFKDHCSFFVASTVVSRRFAAELKPFATGKGTFRFTPQQPIPAILVRKIVRARIAENESIAAEKRAQAKPAPKRRRRLSRTSSHEPG